MPSQCCVYGCYNSDTAEVRSHGISFHRFPNAITDSVRRAEWTVRIKRFDRKQRGHWQPRQSAVICSEHFLPEDFHQQFGRKIIKQDALPTIFSLTLPKKLGKTPAERSTGPSPSACKTTTDAVINVTPYQSRPVADSNESVDSDRGSFTAVCAFPQCSASFVSVHQLLAHETEVHSRVLCSASFESYSGKINASALLSLKHISFMHSYHMSASAGELNAAEKMNYRGLSCPSENCGKILKDIEHLKDHQCCIHSQLPKCTFCRMDFASAHEWIRHVEEHFIRDSYYLCEFCYKTSDNLGSWNEHISSHFEVLVVELDKVPPKKEAKMLANVNYSSDCAGVTMKRCAGNDGDKSMVKCELCLRLFLDEKQLERHTMLKHDETMVASYNFKCSDCGKSFPIKQSLQIHLAHNSLCRRSLQYADLFVQSCFRCHKLCGSWSALNEHFANNPMCLKMRQFKCDECNKCFRRSRALKEHMCNKLLQVTAEKLPFKCNLCNRTFSSQKLLNGHRIQYHALVVHADAEVNVTFESEKKNNGCNACGRIFMSKIALGVHKARYCGATADCRKFNRRHRCDECGKSFKKKISLHDHSKRCQAISELASDTDGKVDAITKHKCHSCSESFKSRYALKLHLKMHLVRSKRHCGHPLAVEASSRKHVVGTCDKIVAQSKPCSNLKRGSSFTCSLCGIEYSVFRSWLLHMKVHLLEEEEEEKEQQMQGADKKRKTKLGRNTPYFCRFCKKRFFISSSYQAHMKLHVIKDASVGGAPAVLDGMPFSSSETAPMPTPVSLFLHNQPMQLGMLIKSETSPLLPPNVYIDTDEKPRLCNVCGIAFDSEEALTAHTAVHALGYMDVDNIKSSVTACEDRRVEACIETFECSVCSQLFASQLSYASHMQEHRSTEANRSIMKVIKNFNQNAVATVSKSECGLFSKHFDCKICAKTFSLWYYYASHMARKHGVKVKRPTIRCTECKRRFSLQGEYNKHLLRAHNIQPSLQSESKRFKCGQCRRYFSRQQSLAAHMATHRDRHLSLNQQKCTLVQPDKKIRFYANLECKMCKNRFGNTRDYFQHVTQHHRKAILTFAFASTGTDEGSSEYKCCRCDKTFTHWLGLSDHLNSRCSTLDVGKQRSKNRETAECKYGSEWEDEDDIVDDNHESDDSDYNPTVEKMSRIVQCTKVPERPFSQPGALGMNHCCKRCGMVSYGVSAYRKHIESHSKKFVNAAETGRVASDNNGSFPQPQTGTSILASILLSEQNNSPVSYNPLEEYSFYFEENSTSTLRRGAVDDSAVGKNSVTAVDVDDGTIAKQINCRPATNLVSSDSELSSVEIGTRTDSACVDGSLAAAEDDNVMECTKSVNVNQHEIESLKTSEDKDTENSTNHLERHCPLCDRTFARKDFLHNHNQMHAINRMYRHECSQCFTSFQRLTELRKHEKLKHSPVVPDVSLSTTAVSTSPYCSTCDRLFENYALAQNHKKMHSTGLVYKYECSECYVPVLRLYSLKRHMRKKHQVFLICDEMKGDVYSCGLCGKMFSESTKLLQHRSDMGHNIYFCKACPKAFHTSVDLQLHCSLKHGFDKVIADEQTQNLKLSVKNKITHSSAIKTGNSSSSQKTSNQSKKLTFKCSACNKFFAEHCYLRRHVRRVHSDKSKVTSKASSQLTCRVCGRHFASQKSTRRHERKQHALGLTEDAICDICRKGFVTPDLLNRHKTFYEGHKVHRCYKCNLGHHTYIALARHLATHFTSDAVHCDECDKTFGSRDLLLKHNFLVHAKAAVASAAPASAVEKVSALRQNRESVTAATTSTADNQNGAVTMVEAAGNKKPDTKYVINRSAATSDENVAESSQNSKRSSCTRCCMVFNSINDLAHHMQVQHGSSEKILQCPICQKVLANRGALKEHTLIHTGEKPYSCHICKRMFRRSKYRSKHIRNMHGKRCAGTSSRSSFVCLLCNKTLETQQCLVDHSMKHAKEIMDSDCSTSNTAIPRTGSDGNTDKPVLLMDNSNVEINASFAKSASIQSSPPKGYFYIKCGKNFPQRENLHRHEQLMHVDFADYELCSPSIDKFQCGICELSFSGKSALDEHAALHNASEYRCEVCMQSFTRKVALERHVATLHTKDKVTEPFSNNEREKDSDKVEENNALDGDYRASDDRESDGTTDLEIEFTTDHKVGKSSSTKMIDCETRVDGTGSAEPIIFVDRFSNNDLPMDEVDEDEVQLVPEINFGPKTVSHNLPQTSSLNRDMNPPILERLMRDYPIHQRTSQTNTEAFGVTGDIQSVEHSDSGKVVPIAIASKKIASVKCAERSAAASCKVCKAEFPTLTALAQHLVVHVWGEQRVCGVCGFVASSRAQLIDHIPSHSSTYR